MKKNVILSIIILFFSTNIQAQIRKVAVLEPFEAVSSIQKAIIRAKLGEALANTGKYATVPRTDIDRMMNEFDFQKNGVMNGDQLKKLGQACDVELICITKISTNEHNLFVESSLINAENGTILVTVNHTVTNAPLPEFEKGCILLATKLAWWSSVGATSCTSKNIDLQNGAVYNPDGIELIYVEGQNSEDAAIKGFFIGKFEVTQAQWKAIMGNNSSHFTGDNLPVENVSWYQAQEFLSKLNAVTNRQYRLPTEAEWEFAARGGTANRFCPDGCDYSGSNIIDEVAWYKGNSGKNTLKRKYITNSKDGKLGRYKYTEHSGNRTRPVGTKQPNELGICDMTGNVWEWCEDWYDGTQQHRTVRGGGWENMAKHCRISARTYSSSGNRDSHLGFRIVLSN